jgi:hypothetical protein
MTISARAAGYERSATADVVLTLYRAIRDPSECPAIRGIQHLLGFQVEGNHFVVKWLGGFGPATAPKSATLRGH